MKNGSLKSMPRMKRSPGPTSAWVDVKQVSCVKYSALVYGATFKAAIVIAYN